MGSLNQIGIKGSVGRVFQKSWKKVILPEGKKAIQVANMASTTETTFTKKTFHTAATVTSPKSSSNHANCLPVAQHKTSASFTVQPFGIVSF